MDENKKNEKENRVVVELMEGEDEGGKGIIVI